MKPTFSNTPSTSQSSKKSVKSSPHTERSPKKSNQSKKKSTLLFPETLVALLLVATLVPQLAVSLVLPVVPVWALVWVLLAVVTLVPVHPSADPLVAPRAIKCSKFLSNLCLPYLFAFYNQ